MKLFVIGDMHLSTSRDWDREIFNKFIRWFSDTDFGNPEECELLQLGDVTERSSNLGDTIEFVMRFFQIASKKFKTIYVLGGNHCHKNVHDVSQYSTKFLWHLNNVKLIYKEEIFNTENGFHILALPYRRVEGKILDDYYSNELPEEFYKTKVDLICGHVALKEPKTFYGGINISKFHSKFRAFGHIHSRNGLYKDDYVGSILPFKIDEEKTELPRIIKIIEKNKTGQLEIPIFVKYEHLRFGETPKVFDDNITRIYTIVNCKNIQQAKNHYPRLFIRGVEKIQNNISVKAGEKVEHFISPLHALDNLLQETKMIIKRKTLSLLKSLLETK